LESSLKSFIDRFRARPEWQSPDPAVRAAAVLRLSAEERELLPGFAEDPDPRVRKAAVKKIHDVGLLVRLATGDPDTGVREEAADTLASMAIHAQDPAAGRAALEGLSQPRQLLTIVRTAADTAVRRAALDLITDAKTLAAAAREAQDSDLRLLAVSRLGDAGQLLSLALNSEHKPVALAATDKLGDEAGLRTVSERAKSPAAARRAKFRLESAGFSTAATATTAAPIGAPAPAVVPSGDDVAEREAYEQKLEALRQEQEARARAVAEREAVCEKLEGAAAELTQDAIDEARGAWEGLSPLQGSEAEALQSRFEAALDACRRRHESWTASHAVRAQLEALLPEAEVVAEGPDLPAARAGLTTLEKKWQETRGDAPAHPDLDERFAAYSRRLGEREAEARKKREAAEKQNLARLTAFALRLETLALSEAPTLRDVDRAMRDAKEALEHPGLVPSKKDKDALHSRLEAARRALYPRLQELRADTEWKRWANESVQEELVGRAAALRSETNLEKAAQALRDLDARWKAAAEVDKEKGETLWKQFKAARDEVRAKVDAYFERRAAEFAEHLKKKEELCVRAEALQDSTDWLRTAEALQKLQVEWKQIGPTAHGPGKAAWERFRKACDHFFRRREADLKQRKEEWGQNEVKKIALIERAEGLAGSTDWDAALAGIKALQAEWKAVGPVKKSRSDVLWQRFRAACDQLFERYKRRDQIALEKSQAEREALLASLEALAPAEASAEAPEGVAARVAEIQASWRQGGPPSRELAAMTDRYRSALQAVVNAFPDAFKGTDLDPENAKKKLTKLCVRLEALVPEAASSTRSLAEQLKDALATNTMGGRGEAEARRRAAADEVRAAREAYARLPPVPGPEGEVLRERFEAAARRATGEGVRS
jgi:Domain of Unknown Function (DUF349)